METKQIEFNGTKIELLQYKDEWVFPLISTYQYGLASPIALELYSYEDNEFDLYTTVTVNLPDSKRNAGCQFVDINNNGEDIIEWLVDNGLGERTSRSATSGFCTYPEFDFYKGQKFMDYKLISEKLIDA